MNTPHYKDVRNAIIKAVPELTKEKEYKLDIVSGVEGDCIVLGDEDSGFRIAGSKPWGGGSTKQSFKVNQRTIFEAIEEKDNCESIIFLLPNWTDRRWFQIVKNCPIEFLQGKRYFLDPQTHKRRDVARWGSMLVTIK